jgi:hypothetical protein
LRRNMESEKKKKKLTLKYFLNYEWLSMQHSWM